MSPSRGAPIQRAISPSGAERRARAGGPAHRLLVIQQAEIILAALADDDPPAFCAGRDRAGRARRRSGAADCGCRSRSTPALVLLGPQARRRDIAQRLADAGAGLGQHDLRLVGRLARAEGGGDGGGVIRLLRPRLGVVAEQLRETLARLVRLDRLAARRRRRRALLPLVSFANHDPAGRLLRGAGRFAASARQHRRAPGPAAALIALGDGAGLGVGPSDNSCSSALGRGRQRTRPRPMPVPGGQAERARQPARRRHAEHRRPDEGKAPADRAPRTPPFEPPCGGAGVTHHRRFGFEPGFRLVDRQRLDLAIRREPHHLAEPGDQGRCARARGCAPRYGMEAWRRQRGSDSLKA